MWGAPSEGSTLPTGWRPSIVARTIGPEVTKVRPSRRAPVPGTPHLTGAWGSSASDVFAVGDGGVILHYDGRAWSPMQSGQGTLLHYDGSSWRPAPTGTTEPLYTVWGAGAEVFVVGRGGTILHR